MSRTQYVKDVLDDGKYFAAQLETIQKSFTKPEKVLAKLQKDAINGDYDDLYTALAKTERIIYILEEIIDDMTRMAGRFGSDHDGFDEIIEDNLNRLERDMRAIGR